MSSATGAMNGNATASMRPRARGRLRLGFQYEGLFRQAVVYKQRNRDTAWFSIIDSEWPPLKRAYEQWLATGKFRSSRQTAARFGRIHRGGAITASENARHPGTQYRRGTHPGCRQAVDPEGLWWDGLPARVACTTASPQ